MTTASKQFSPRAAIAMQPPLKILLARTAVAVQPPPENVFLETANQTAYENQFQTFEFETSRHI